MNIFIGIVLIVAGIVICVLGWDAVIFMSTPTFKIFGIILVDIGIAGVFYHNVYSFIKQFFPDNLFACRILTVLPFVLLLVFFIIWLDVLEIVFESLGRYMSKKYDEKYVKHIIINTKNFSEILLKKDDKKKIIKNKTSIEIDKENYAMYISIEYDADKKLISLIEMIDYVFDNGDKICTMILENLEVNSLEIDTFCLLEVTIHCKYIELCCWIGLFDTIDFKLDWETKEYTVVKE